MGSRTKVSATLILAAVLALALAATGLAGSARTELVSVNSSGEPGNDDSAADANSFRPAISADGRYIAFTSEASNLVPGDTNGDWDVFVRDRELGTTERVSLSSTGREGNRNTFEPAISADGRYVAFRSYASNLVARDTNGTWDVFVRDRELGTTERVSVSSTGREGDKASWAPAISADGRYVAFASQASGLVPDDDHFANFVDVFVRDRKLDTTKRVSVSSSGRRGRGYSDEPAISADGRYVAFASQASNLVPRDTNDDWDVFVRDRKRHVTRRVSVSSSGHQARRHGANPPPSSGISADGRYVAFVAAASNLVPRDTNGVPDVFVRDRKRHTTRRLSVSSTGQQGAGRSRSPAISANGRYVAFASTASNLVAGDTNGFSDVFVRDRTRDKTRRVSISSSGQPGNRFSIYPAISADGRYVAFASTASNLIAGDTNDFDVFIRGPI